MLIMRVIFVAAIVLQSSPALAQVNIIQAPTNYIFVDMGYDAENDEVALVGILSRGEGVTQTQPATLFELNATNDGFTTQTLANLPGATSQANVGFGGISSDASRIAGFADTGDVSSGEGLTWLRSDPDNPTGIGFVQGEANRSSAGAAWKDGVVGTSGISLGGTQIAVSWDQDNGIQPLPGSEGGFARASSVNSDGSVFVGVSNLELIDGAAYYWDAAGLHRLNDQVPGFTTHSSIASCVSPDGNFIGGELYLRSPQFGFFHVAVIWEGNQRTLRLLRDSNDEFANGAVNDISDSGYAVGLLFAVSGFDQRGFVWHDEFTNGVQVFEDWLEESHGANFPFTTDSVESISEGNGKLFFTARNPAVEFALVEFESILGDVNHDRHVDFSDISPFIQLLSSGGYQLEADTYEDGVVDFSDIAPFIGLLSGN